MRLTAAQSWDYKLDPPNDCTDAVHAEYTFDSFEVASCEECEESVYLEGLGDVVIHEGNIVELCGFAPLELVRAKWNGKEIDRQYTTAGKYKAEIEQAIAEQLRQWSRFEFEERPLTLERVAG